MSRPTLWRLLLGLGTVILIGVLVIVYLRSSTPPTVVWETSGMRGPLTRSITLYFGAVDGSGLVAEHREIVAAEDQERSMRRVVDEILRGPAGTGVVALFDSRARVRSLFVGEDGSVVLDFAGAPLPEGASAPACDLAMQSLMRVFTERFAFVTSVSLLVDGAPLSEIERRLAVPLVIEPAVWLSPDGAS